MRSRLLISGLAASGALETGFLSYTKLVPDLLTTFCTDNTCSDVLSGPYSTIPVINVPLVSVAFVSYAAVSFLALSPYLKKNTIIVEETIKKIIDPTLLFIVTSRQHFHVICWHCYSLLSTRSVTSASLVPSYRYQWQ